MAGVDRSEIVVFSVPVLSGRETTTTTTTRTKTNAFIFLCSPGESAPIYLYISYLAIDFLSASFVASSRRVDGRGHRSSGRSAETEATYKRLRKDSSLILFIFLKP